MAMGGTGIGLVVTLTEESPLPPEWFEGAIVTNLFAPSITTRPQHRRHSASSED